MFVSILLFFFNRTKSLNVFHFRIQVCKLYKTKKAKMLCLYRLSLEYIYVYTPRERMYKHSLKRELENILRI